MKLSFSSCPQREKFEELAALAAVGEAGALELEHLRQHLAGCSSCSAAYEAFANLASNDLGLAAAKRESTLESGEAGSYDRVDESEGRELLQGLRNRLKARQSGLHEPDASLSVPSIGDVAGRSRAKQHRGVFALAAMIFLALTLAGGAAIWRMTKALSTERARSGQLQTVVDSLKQQRADQAGSDNAVLRSLRESQEARDALQKSLAASEAKNRRLLAGEKASEEKLVAAIADSQELKQKLDASNADRERLGRLRQESNAKLFEALMELYQARQANTETAMKTQTSEDVSVPSVARAPSPSEADARNLFGARDLHIVDVYDVSGDGKTKRTYGRVYYVEKKLLVFYAFDLQNRHGRKQGVFQAWGYREANVGKPVSLGLFSIDDSSMQRWVLTENRPDVLSHIDAVFVTFEPPGGSTTPRGKKVLYANLIGPPNHP
jgi:hypothetical protein